MKKKLVAATLTASMILSMGVATVPVMAKDDGEPYKVALLLNGTLGDKSFFDSANAGMEALQEELGEDKFTYKVEQMELHQQMKQNGSLQCMITVMMVLMI